MSRYYAITLKCNHRDTLENDIHSLKVGIRFLNSNFCDIATGYKFELQPKGLHNLHVHILGKRSKDRQKFTSYNELHYYMSLLDINMDIREIHGDSLEYWSAYCRKYRGDLAYDYAETTGSELNKIRIFDHNVTAQQKVKHKRCNFCGEIKGKICGIYKCWISKKGE